MEVETERLRLRPLRMSDADGLLRLQQEPEMMRYFGDGHVYGADESRFWLEWHVAMWNLEGYGFWAVEQTAHEGFAGWLGVTKVWEPPDLMPVSEVGWFLEPSCWGQGLATEGAREALRFAFGPLRLPRVIARYNADNRASGRVMEKIGMRLWQERPHPERSDQTVRIYEKYAD